MVININTVVKNLLKTRKPTEIADTLGITEALISTWKNKENDFCPRVGVAAKVYKHYDVVVYPYGEEALVWYLENTK